MKPSVRRRLDRRPWQMDEVRLNDPAEIAAEALKIPAERVSSVERIPGGLTNDSWLVRTGHEAVVVRISNADERALQIGRVSEARVLEVVQQAGIGPRIVSNCPERHFLVTRYCAGAVWTRDDARRPENVRRIARVLRRLHSLPPPTDVQRTDLVAIVQGYWATLLERVGSPASRELSVRSASYFTAVEQLPAIRALGGRLMFERMSHVAATLATGAHRLCHNDPNHLNVVAVSGRSDLATGEAWVEGLCLLDWEYAGLGDPYFDLAGVCCYHALDDASRYQLLAHYRSDDSGEPLAVTKNAGYGRNSGPVLKGEAAEEAEALARLEAMCELFEYIARLWTAVRETSGAVSGI